MSGYTWLIIAALAIFGALAARLGDYLGYRVGRRRLSLFGLRPRTTGMVIGMLIGALVPLVTAGLAALAHENVRIALFRLDKVRAATAEAQQERARAERERDAARQHAREATLAAQQARAAADQAIAEAESAEQRADALRLRVAGLRGRLADIRGQLQHVRDQYTTLEAKAAGLRDSNAELNERLTQLAQGITESERKLRATEDKLTATKNRLRDAKSNQQQAEAEVRRTEATLKSLREEVDSRQASLDRLLDLVGKAEQVVKRLITRAATGEQITNPGEELVRRVVRTDVAQRRVEDELLQLLRTASEVAAQRGATVDSQTGRAVEIWHPVRDSETETVRLPSTAEVIEAVAAALRKAPVETQVVSVIAVARAFRQEIVPVAFRAVPNFKVFDRDEVVVSGAVDGRLELEQIGAALWLLLRREARRRAGAEGILAQPGPEGGRVSFRIEELFRAASAIKDRARPVLVNVRALQDTYVAGPLQVRIEVTDLQKEETP